MRRKVKNRNVPGGDPLFDSTDVEKFTNCLMLAGKKSIARGIVYQAFDIIKKKENIEDPLEVFDRALKNAGPSMEVRSRRVGGANYQVPREVRPARKMALAIRWIIGAARSKEGTPMEMRLAEELIAASKNEGEAITKRDNTHKMAEANKAFAHFAW